jgi:hypothetical protein
MTEPAIPVTGGSSVGPVSLDLGLSPAILATQV